MFTWTNRSGQEPVSPAIRADRRGKFQAINHVDGIKQRHGGPHLVGLQRANKVQFNVREALEEGRPLSLGFLQPILAEDAMSLSKHRLDAIKRLKF